MADITRVQTVAVDADTCAHPATAAANGIPSLAASTFAARVINVHIPTELLEMILLAAERTGTLCSPWCVAVGETFSHRGAVAARGAPRCGHRMLLVCTLYSLLCGHARMVFR